MKGLVAAFALAPCAGHAGFDVLPMRYICDRGAEVQAAYVNDTSGLGSAAIVFVEGRMVTLWVEESASGARYGWPSDGSHYVWWTKGEAATLLWHNGENGEETVLLAECKVQG